MLKDPVIGPALKKTVLTSRVGQPRDIVGPAILLASEEEAFFVTGKCLNVDGGMGIIMPIPALAPAEA